MIDYMSIFYLALAISIPTQILWTIRERKRPNANWFMVLVFTLMEIAISTIVLFIVLFGIVSVYHDFK